MLQCRALLFCGVLMAGLAELTLAGGQNTPQQVPPRRSTQLSDGFGMNLPLPRDPSLPWTRHWWTSIFDSGVKWVRLGQYENSSEKTSWDWVEQTQGVFSCPKMMEGNRLFPLIRSIPEAFPIKASDTTETIPQ